MLDVIGAAPGSENTIDWPVVWNESEERQAIKATLKEMKETLSHKPVENNLSALDPYAAPFNVQLRTVLTRVFEQYWRTPSYLYSKIVLCASSVSFP